MRITVVPNEYTQLNTVSDAFLLQNLSNYDVWIKVSDTKPSDDADYDFFITHGEGISDSHFNGICWGKINAEVNGIVGIVEG